MSEPTKKVAVIELRRLLFELNDHRPDICVRYRLLGQMWAANFLRVTLLTDKGVLLNDESSGKFLKVPDLSQIMQFELDKPFQLFQPYYHYDVITSLEW